MDRNSNLLNVGLRVGATIPFPTHVYIIDDNISFGKSLRRLLTACGFSVDYFESAQVFLDSVLPDRGGCAIVDIHMPDCDGFSLIDKMRVLRYDMGIIVISGLATNEARDLAFQKGALGLLQKPFSEESLLELLERAGSRTTP